MFPLKKNLYPRRFDKKFAYIIKRIVFLLAKRVPIINLLIHNKLYARFIKGAWWSLIGAIISQGLTLLASFPVAKMLGPEGYGELGIIQSTLAMFALFGGTSLGSTATKYVAELGSINPNRASRIISLSFSTATVIGGILSLSLIFGASFLSRDVLNASQLTSSLRISAFALFFNSINGVQTGTLAGFQSFRRLAQVNMYRGLISFPLILIGVWLWDLNGAIIALAITAGLAVILNHWTIIEESHANGVSIITWGGFSEWRILLSFTVPAILSGIVVLPVTWWANVLLVNSGNGYHEMGVINATNQWKIALTFLPFVLTQPTLSILSKLLGVNSYLEYKHVLIFNIYIVLLSISIPAIGIIIGAPFIMSAYGFDGNTNLIVLRLISISTIISAVISVIGKVIFSFGKMWHGFSINLIWALVFIFTFLMHEKNALGLATAFLISYIIHFGVVSIYSFLILRRIINFRYTRTMDEY